MKKKRQGGVKRGKYLSTKTGIHEKYDSGYELRRFEALDASPLVKSWTKRHRLAIPYVMDGKVRHYVPDILVITTDGRKILEEVKGKIFDLEEFNLKCVAAKHWSRATGLTYRLIYEEDLPLFLLPE